MNCRCPMRKPKVGEMFHTSSDTSLWLVLAIVDGRTYAAARYRWDAKWKPDTAMNRDIRYPIIEGAHHGHTFYD